MSKQRGIDVVSVDRIEPRILLIRAQWVTLDADLAELYGTTTKALNQAVKRNLGRFPADFMFQLTTEEVETMRSQIVTASGAAMRSQFATASKRNVRYLPYAFTEHGALMAASILNTPRAMDVSVFVVRAFVKLRELLSSHKELAGKLAELERKVGAHDVAIQPLLSAIREFDGAATGAPASPNRFSCHPGGQYMIWTFHGPVVPVILGGYLHGDSLGIPAVSDFDMRISDFQAGCAPIELGAAGGMMIMVFFKGPCETHGNGVRATGFL